MTLQKLPFWLVDVFAREPLSGNGLSVFLLDEELPADAMQRITREMRQFETIFVRRGEQPARFHARIFTMEEELPFAGHPVIGAAARLHAEFFAADEVARLEFVIRDRRIEALSRRRGDAFIVEMDQGVASFEPPVAEDRYPDVLKALNLAVEDLAPGLPLQVVSTGLPYLIVPVARHLERARIVIADFEELLATLGAKFGYVLDVNLLEGRTWDNDGRVEDIATGSAAGPAAAFLVAHERLAAGENIVLAQGRFVDRPSELNAVVESGAGLGVRISGRVCFVGSGALELPSVSL